MSGMGVKKWLLVDPWRTGESFGGVWVIQNYSGYLSRLMGGVLSDAYLTSRSFKSKLSTDGQTDGHLDF